MLNSEFFTIVAIFEIARQKLFSEILKMLVKCHLRFLSNNEGFEIHDPITFIVEPRIDPAVT